MAATEKRPRLRWLHFGAGLLVSVLALALALRKTSAAEVEEALRGAQWHFLPLMVGLKAAAILVRGVRWRVELGAMAPGPYRRAIRATALGYFANLMLPFRLGELLRVALLRRHNQRLRAGDVLASVAAERILDGAVIALLVMAFLPALQVEAWILRSTLLLLGLTFAALLLTMVEPLHSWVESRLPATGALRFMGLLVSALSRGSAVMRVPKALFFSALLTAAAWLMEAAVVYCACLALALDLPFGACLVILFLMSFGLLVPSAPGQVGTHQALALIIMVPLGLGDTQAVSVSVLMQIVSLGTLGAAGTAVLLSESGAREVLRDADPD